MIAAARRLALATAIAVPMAVGGAGTVAAAGGAVYVTVAQTINVQGGDPQQLIALLKRHNAELAKSLTDEVQRELARRKRGQY